MSVYLRRGFLDATACARIRRAMALAPSEAAGVLDDPGTAREGRNAWFAEVGEATVAEVETCLDAARDALARFFGRPLGAREGAGFLRYEAGGFYGPHRDRGEQPDWPAAARRRVSAVLFLNGAVTTDGAGAFEGGRLRIWIDPSAPPVDVTPEEGTLVAFLADTLHEVTPVTAGVRYAVVDWFGDPDGPAA